MPTPHHPRPRRLAVEALEARRLLALAPELVADLNTTPRTDPTQPWSTAVVGDEFFFPQSGPLGYELWKSDGTTEGTVLVADVHPGPRSSFPRDLTNHGGMLYFTATDDVSGDELWRSDGTAAGTVRVADVSPGPRGSRPEQLTPVGDQLFFTASTPEFGRELWRTDGTAAGTRLVEDMRQGLEGSTLTSLTKVAETLFFVEVDGSSRRLWKSDGAADGTERIEVVDGLSSLAHVSHLTEVDGTLYFTAQLKNLGIWTSDGTAEGTVQFTTKANPRNLGREVETVAFNDLFYFLGEFTDGESELWRSDGTEEGTMRVDHDAVAEERDPHYLTPLGDALYFAAEDEDSAPQVWATDGTTAGTKKVTDFVWQDPLQEPRNLTPAGGRLFFTLAERRPSHLNYDSAGDLWAIHDSEAQKVYDGRAQDIRSFGGAALFRTEGEEGPQLWRSDGSVAGTFQVASLDFGTEDGEVSSLTPGDDVLYFVTGDGQYDRRIWATGGAVEGVQHIADSRNVGFALPSPLLLPLGDVVIFASYTVETGIELWTASHANEGVLLLRNIQAGLYSSFPRELAVLNERLYFTAHSRLGLGETARRVWTSDGTTDGTYLVADVSPDRSRERPYFLTELGEYVYFTSGDVPGESGIWRTTGSPAETVHLVDLWSVGAGHGPQYLTTANEILFFMADDGIYGKELWRLDETTELGAVRLTDVTPGVGDSDPREMIASGPYLYFSAVVTNGSNGDVELWRTDGTLDGTIRVAAITETFIRRYSYSYGRTDVDGTLFFVAESDESVFELWKTEGTPETTTQVSEIGPGELRGGLSELTNVNETLFFTAYDGVSGRELWISDGTSEGTRLFADLAPGLEDSYPRDLVVQNGVLYFTADDGVHGRELWKLEPPAGDSNFDGVVDLTDFNRLKGNFGRTEPNLAGDFNHDDRVDLADFNLLKGNFGAGAEPAATPDVAPTPPAFSVDLIAAAAIDAVLSRDDEPDA